MTEQLKTVLTPTQQAPQEPTFPSEFFYGHVAELVDAPYLKGGSTRLTRQRLSARALNAGSTPAMSFLNFWLRDFLGSQVPGLVSSLIAFPCSQAAPRLTLILNGKGRAHFLCAVSLGQVQRLEG